jgi:hypothetical protein
VKITTSYNSKAKWAFTLPEILITMALFMLVIGGVIAAHLYGLKLCKITQVKLGASDDARKLMGKLVDEVHSATMLRIGNATNGNDFVEITSGRLEGNAVRIGLSPWVLYFCKTDTNCLYRVTSDDPTDLQLIASSVTNSLVFTAEDALPSQTVLSNYFGNWVLGVKLVFNQVDYNPPIPIGPGNYFDNYKLETRIGVRPRN